EQLAVDIDTMDEAAGPQHMRIAQQILGTIDRGKTDVQAVERGGQFGRLAAPDLFGDTRNDPVARHDPVGGVAQRGILDKFLESELAAKALPMTFGHDADEDAFAARGLENII